MRYIIPAAGAVGRAIGGRLSEAGHDRGGGSSRQSLSRGAGTIEADRPTGEIVLLGRFHGVSAPVDDTLRRMANTFASERREPGSLSGRARRSRRRRLPQPRSAVGVAFLQDRCQWPVLAWDA
ncbi:hypothetical protein ACFCZT_36730 [Streptomyces sp. NPDC056230]|uniref:hypothetical protein n=1 Tax=Streptomyces sp. NPDC056230 TaxID=3345754 RepID=UPI0035E096E6